MVTLVLTPNLHDKEETATTSLVLFFQLNGELKSLSADLTDQTDSHNRADEIRLFSVSNVRMHTLESGCKTSRKEEIK